MLFLKVDCPKSTSTLVWKYYLHQEQITYKLVSVSDIQNTHKIYLKLFFIFLQTTHNSEQHNEIHRIFGNKDGYFHNVRSNSYYVSGDKYWHKMPYNHNITDENRQYFQPIHQLLNMQKYKIMQRKTKYRKSCLYLVSSAFQRIKTTHWWLNSTTAIIIRLYNCKQLLPILNCF